jgi:predicted nuclease of restriction endonuclease-like (RecB) superfamily
MATDVEVFEGYGELLEQLKSDISSSRLRASLKVNQELIALYWRIGNGILTRQQQKGWGAKVISHLAIDLKKAFPEFKGLSRTNLHYMRAFAAAWPNSEFVQQSVGQLPWGHNLTLLDRLDDHSTRLWYAAKASEHGWSRNVLELQIATRLHERQPSVATNFKETLPSPQSDLARQTIKDPYNFEFLNVSDRAAEREIHQGLIEHIRSFLLELGAGFAFVGSEYHLEIDGQDFYIDLLFYHLKLHCYVVVELKAGKFQPEHAGKMNFYLSAVDDLVRDGATDQPTIGILLCKSKSGIIAEYALRDTKKPMGISTYLTEELPHRLQESLPSQDEIHAELGEANKE